MCALFKKTLNNKYEVTEKLGAGSHSVVWGAKNIVSGELVAIKEVLNLSDKHLAKRCYREIKLLQHFEQHPNIISIKDLFVPEKANERDFDTVFIVMERMTTDLHKLILSDAHISDDHILLFVYQILCALKAIHAANVIHRDLKPQNILLNVDLEVKLCDFGTGRRHEDESSLRMTCLHEVATPYYRAPEGVLNKEEYSKSVDLWAVGCILAELITREPLLPGKNNKELMELIVDLIGYPTSQELEKYPPSRLKDIAFGRPSANPPASPSPSSLSPPSISPTSVSPPVAARTKKTLKEALPGAPDVVVDFIRQLLMFDPEKRLTVEKALEHPYLTTLHDVTEETGCAFFDDHAERKGGQKLNWRDLLWEVIKRYKQPSPENPRKRRHLSDD